MTNYITKKIIILSIAATSILAQASVCSAGTSKPQDFKMRGTAFSVGAAYSITDCTRVGITASRQPKNLTSSGGKNYTYSATKLMFNLYQEYSNPSKLNPFIMFGAGISNSKLKWAPKGLKGNFSSGNVNKFSYEAGVGVEYKIKPTFGVSVTYKLSNMPSFKMKDYTDGSTLIKNWKTSSTYQHSAGLGIRYIF